MYDDDRASTPCVISVIFYCRSNGWVLQLISARGDGRSRPSLGLGNSFRIFTERGKEILEPRSHSSCEFVLIVPWWRLMRYEVECRRDPRNQSTNCSPAGLRGTGGMS